MTEINNVKSIVINGNKINKVATFYNSNIQNKDKTLLSVKAGEELVSKIPVGGSSDADKFRKKTINLLTDCGTFHSVNENGETVLKEDVLDFTITTSNDTYNIISSPSNRIHVKDSVIIPSILVNSNDLNESYELNSGQTIYIEADGECDFYCPNNITINLNVNDKDIYFNTDLVDGNLILNEEIGNSGVYVYLTKSYEDYYLDEIDLDERVKVYIGKNFFNYIDLNMMDEGMFGDWSEFKGTVEIVSDGINTSVDDYEYVVEKLRYIFKNPTLNIDLF